MNDQAFEALEYDAVRALVGARAETPMGRARAAQMAPLDELAAVHDALRAVGECRALRSRGADWSFAGLADPSSALARLRIRASALEPLELLNLARLCLATNDARAAIEAERDRCPTLWRTVAELPPPTLGSVATRITERILPSGELDDRASPELARIRARLNRLRADITRLLEQVLRRFPEAAQDAIVTMRNDRFVVPIRADHRGRIAGVAHGFSSSGATVFIEPLEAVEANNELQALREEEERETARILLGLSDELRAHLDVLNRTVNAVAELDFVRAKALLAESTRATDPEVAERSPLELVEARHPILEENLRRTGGEIIPVSFKLDDDHAVMIISGANAGGKTVVLKTAGLLALMALSGLHVPARRARFPFYRSVLADIGDHQSLAANLSTFTSHMANIRRMMELCQPPALVLLDEVGTGTDPEEGSALGVAIVDHFRRACGAHVIATTHYGGLKMYAATEKGVLNASVEFDERTLAPTYRLIVGLPGASAGLEIAQRCRIPPDVIEAARQRVSAASRAASDYLQHLRRETELAEALRRALEEEREAVAARYRELETEFAQREERRQREFEHELQAAVTAFERHAQELVAKIEDRIVRERAAREAERSAAQARRTAREAVARRAAQNTVAHGAARITRRRADNTAERPTKAREIAVGDRVRLSTLGGAVGTVERIDGDQAEVRTGVLRFREKLRNLELLDKSAQEQDDERWQRAVPPGTEVRVRTASRELREELNLIGRTTDEAAEEIDRFLDEAYLNNLDRVRIIHGHGTGALRRAVADVLRAHPHVARFSLAPPEQGGAGATIVELKR